MKPDELTFGHSGDFGDVVFALALIKSCGGGHVRLYDRPYTKAISTRSNVIVPLLEAQPYIKSVKVMEPDEHTYDLSKFRSHYQPDRTLLMSQCLYATRAYGLPVVRGAEPWLTAKKIKATKGRVVIARSPRYHNNLFPWARILARYGSACVFIGLKAEHSAFEAAFGSVEYLKTENLLDVAEAIAGSDLFVGNQSSPNSVAEGLKHPRILEVNERNPDCIYPNHGVLCYTRFLPEFPAAGGKEHKILDPEPLKVNPIECNVVPPGMWQYPGCNRGTHLINVARELSKKEQITVEQATQMVYEYQCVRLPDFFRDTSEDGKFSRVQKALNRIQ